MGLKVNTRNMTKLLVSFSLGTRERLAAMSRASNTSQQQIIRSGVELILLSLEEQYARPAPESEPCKHRPLAIVQEQAEPSREPAAPPPVGSLDAMLGAIREDQREHGAVTRMTSTSARTVTMTFQDGWKNQYDTPGSQDTAGMNQALRSAFPTATTKLFRGGAA
jgi:hypothetical protein